MAIRTEDARTRSATRPEPPRLVPPHELDEHAEIRFPRRPSMAGRPDPARATRHLGPAGRVLAIGLGCFLLWGLLAAPALKREAEVSPLGARRSAALAVLGPLARLSSFLSLDRVGSLADRVLHRHRFGPLPAAGAPEPFRPGDRSLAGSPGPVVLPTGSPSIGPSPSGSPSPFPSALVGVLPRPSAQRPVRVLAVGDSLGGDLAIGLGRSIGSRHAWDLATDWREATGLARPDYFDWTSQIASDLERDDPEIVVAMFGANDAQGTLVDGKGYLFDTPRWRAAYRARVDHIMSMVTGSGRVLVWVGMPPMGSDRLSSGMRTINALVQAEAADHPGVVFLDTWPLFAGSNGRYSPYLPDAAGVEQAVRTGDGVHLTAAGDDRLAQRVLEAIAPLFRSARHAHGASSPPPKPSTN